MVLPLPTTPNARHYEDNVKFYVKDGRWQEELPYYEHTGEYGVTANDLRFDVDLIDCPPPQTYIKSYWTFVPAAATNLQFNFKRRNGNWFDWTQANMRADVFGSLLQGGSSWAKGEWVTTFPPSAQNGIYANWGDGNQKLATMKLAQLTLDVHAYNNASSNVSWNLSYLVGNTHTICRGQAWMMLHPRDIATIQLHCDGTVNVGSSRVKTI